MHLQVLQLDVWASDLKSRAGRSSKRNRRERKRIKKKRRGCLGAARLLFGDLGRGGTGSSGWPRHTDVHRNKAQIVVCNCALLIHINTSHTHTHRERQRKRGKGGETHLLLRAANSIAYFGALVGCANKK